MIYASLSDAEGTCLFRHFIVIAGRLSAAPLHDPVESLEIRPRFSILEEVGGFESRNLLRNGVATNWLMLVPSCRLSRATAILSERGSRSGYVSFMFMA
jgi:hypothetical protein